MNKSNRLARILAIGGVLEAGVGLALLLVPSAVASILLRSPLEGAGQVVARLGGGGFLALGIACWAAGKSPLSPAGLGVARAFLLYNVVACVLLTLARPPLAMGGLPALATAALHGLLAGALLISLVGPGRPATGS